MNGQHAPQGGTEVELKLAGDPGVLEAVFASPVIGARATGRGAIQLLENVYYDTADQRLRAQGLAFRVRRRGRRYVETLKSGDAGGLVAYRGEWEAPLPSPEPDLALLPAGASERLEQVCDGAVLRPLFTTRVRRHVRRLRTADQDGRPATVEAALDLGTIEADGQRLPLAELELELLEGAPEVLYDLALALEAVAPLHVETRSKSARGYALSSGEPPAWHKAPPLALGRGATVDQAVGAILRNCLAHWLANEAAALDGHDPEGLHQMRVGLRRLRSALSVFRRVLPQEPRAGLDAAAKRIINALGPARDLDVFLAELLTPVLAARPDDAGLARLRALAESARDEAYGAARSVIAAPEYTRFVLELGRWIEAGGWRDGTDREAVSWHERPIVEFADHLLAKRHKKALKCGHHFARLSAGERHQVRIALKKLRYCTEFFDALYLARRTRPYLKALKRLQDTLGHLNDVAVAGKLLACLTEGDGGAAEREALHRAAGMVLGWHARGARDLEPATVESWRTFAARKPFWH